jgi:hypothetical protein
MEEGGNRNPSRLDCTPTAGTIAWDDGSMVSA